MRFHDPRWQVSQRYGCQRSSPGQARRFCIDALANQVPLDGPGADLVEDAGLIVDELVTNAINAGCGSALVRIAVERTPDRTQVRLAVDDDAPGRPEPRYPGPTDTRGRGLRILNAIAADWGVTRAGRGKRVWALLALP